MAEFEHIAALPIHAQLLAYGGIRRLSDGNR